MNKEIFSKNEVFYLIADVQIMNKEEIPELEKAMKRIINDVSKNKHKFVNIVSLGDEIEGNLRHQSEKNDGAISSSYEFSNLFTSFLKKLSKISKVQVIYVERSNHTQIARNLDQKGISFRKEDLSRVILTQIKSNLKGVKNINFYLPPTLVKNPETGDGGIIVYKNMVFTHGHYSRFKNPRLIDLYISKMELDCDYKYFVLGHFHHHKVLDIGNGKIIYVGALKQSVTEYDKDKNFVNLYPQFQKITTGETPQDLTIQTFHMRRTYIEGENNE